MNNRENIFISLQMNKDPSHDAKFKAMPPKEKIDFIAKKIRTLCEELKKNHPDAHVILAWNEYGIEGVDKQSISTEEKAMLKAVMAELTKTYPLTIIAGTVMVEKSFQKMSQDRLDRILGFYKNDPTFSESYEKQDLVETINSNKKNYLNHGATVVRNTCYIFENGECIHRYDKNEPYRELTSSEKIYQPGNKKGNQPIFICNGTLKFTLEICYEHQKALLREKKLQGDLQLLISNSTNIDLDAIVAPLFIQMDSKNFPFPIASGQEESIDFYKVNLFDDDVGDMHYLPITDLENSLFLACYQDNEHSIRRILTDPGFASGLKEQELYGTTSLHLMIEKRQEDELIALSLKRGFCDVNAISQNNQTPLYLAVKTKQSDVVKILIDYLADVNDSQLTTPNACTPLALAVLNNDETTAKFLIDAGANVQVKVNGDPLIFHALEQRNFQLAHALALAGACVNLESNYFHASLSLLAECTNNILKTEILAKFQRNKVLGKEI